MTSTPPPHLSLSLFRRYEPYISTAISRHPLATPIAIPTTLAHTTFVARLRDAINSLERYRWQTAIPMDTFLSAKLKVAYRSPIALVGSAAAIRDHLNAPPEAPVVVGTKPIFDLLSCSDLRLLCYLAANGQLTGPIRLSIPAESVDSLLETFDIDLEDVGDGKYILT